MEALILAPYEANYRLCEADLRFWDELVFC